MSIFSAVGSFSGHQDENRQPGPAICRTLHPDPLPSGFLSERFGDNMRAVVFGVIPEEQKILVIGKTLVQLGFQSTREYLFMKFFRFFYHSRLQFIHWFLRTVM